MVLLIMTALAADRAILPIVKSQPAESEQRVRESDACRDVDRGMDRELEVYVLSADSDTYRIRWDEGHHPVLTAELDLAAVDADWSDVRDPGAVYLSYLLYDGTKVHMVSSGSPSEGIVEFKLSLDAVDALARSAAKLTFPGSTPACGSASGAAGLPSTVRTWSGACRGSLSVARVSV